MDVASSGPNALWHPLEFGYDAVVLDVMLVPGLSGIEVCRQPLERRRWVPVLMPTARAAVAHRFAGGRPAAGTGQLAGPAW